MWAGGGGRGSLDTTQHWGSQPCSAVSRTGLPAHESCGAAGESPVQDHTWMQNAQGACVLWGEPEGAGTAPPGSEEAQGDSLMCTQV